MVYTNETHVPGVSRALAGAALACALMLSQASLAVGQTVVDPHYVQFKPSPDHHVVSNGVAVVTRYDLEFFQLGGLIPIEVLNIGKPLPAGDGNIYVSFQPTFPVPGITYQARVAAVGPGGAVDSNASNLFTFTGKCNFVLSTTLLSSTPNGGSASVNVLTNSGCTWTPTTSASWITILTNSTAGPGNVSLSVAANNTASARIGYVSLAGQLVTIVQAAAGASSGGCSTALTTSVSAAAAGLAGTIGVSAGEGCSWQASSPASWAAVSPSSGRGAGTVTYNIAPNTSTSARSTTLLVAGASVAVTQAAVGAPAPSTCAVAATTSLSVAASGGSAAVALKAAEACSWQASSPVSWATISPASGKGAGKVTYRVAANTSATPRTTTLVIGGTSVALTQAAAVAAGSSCSPTISATSASLAVGGGTGSVGVTARAGCEWTASTSSSWVTLSPLSGTANGSVTYKAAANTSNTLRVATLTIGGQVVMLSQAGQTTSTTCVHTVSTSNISVPAAASSGSLSITATGCVGGWQASSQYSWVVFQTTSGATTSATVTYQIAPNPTASSRTATVNVNGQAITVTQAGACKNRC